MQVPPPDAYFEPINWHRTALHELGHWPAAIPSRLDRDLVGQLRHARSTPLRNWSPRYRAAFVCASLGIVPTVRHADYLGSWLEVLREDNRAIVRAAAGQQGGRLSARLPAGAVASDTMASTSAEQEVA